MKAIPVLDRIIIEQDQAETSVGKFLLSETSQVRPRQGTVMKVGPGKMENGQLIPMMANVGDKVMYAEFAGATVMIEGKEYIVIKESDLLLIL